MVKPTLPLAGYPRVSRQGDRDELRSPELQVKKMQALADAEGLKIEFTEPEIDVSGSKPRRAILDEVIRRVKAGELGGIVVAKLDRLSRLSPKDRVVLFEEIEDAGGVILSASEQLDPSTPEGRFAREVFLGIARMQWEKYRDDFEDAKAGAVERGISVSRNAPAGYVKRNGEGEDRRLEPDPAAAPVIREVFERRATGAGPAELGDLLTRNGITTSAGSKEWSRRSVYRLITNPVYKGTVRYGTDDRYVNADAHEAIVDEVLWQAAQHPNGGKLSRVSETSTRLLSGLLRCAACRYCMQGTNTRYGKPLYRCAARHAAGICPAPARVYAEEVEEAVIGAFWSITEDIEARGVQHDDGSDLAALQDAFDKADARVLQLQSADAQDALGDDYFSTFRERRRERETAAESLGRARAERETDGRDSRSSVETLRGAWERMTIAQRRELLGLRLDCVAAGGSRDGQRSLVVYPKGTGPADLPRRGRTVPVLVPFPDAPKGARVLSVD